MEKKWSKSRLLTRGSVNFEFHCAIRCGQNCAWYQTTDSVAVFQFNLFKTPSHKYSCFGVVIKYQVLHLSELTSNIDIDCFFSGEGSISFQQRCGQALSGHYTTVLTSNTIGNRDNDDGDDNLHLFQNVGHSNRCCWVRHIPSPGALLLQIGIVLKANCIG